ncbi:MAG: phosphatidylserine/phosphatidylglycerophosphate/cardiolipin synthase family protein [bacterium]
MKYKFYTTSEKAWAAMFEAISNAKKSIYLEMYIFSDNTENYDFFNSLGQKARSGVKVKIIIDASGSAELNKQTIKKIIGAGAELLFFNHWLHRSHRKILIVDENTAFWGGVNIHKYFQKWDDLQVRVKGRFVKNIVRSFARAYGISGGKDQSILSLAEKNMEEKTGLWLVEHWHLSNHLSLKKYYVGKIESAQKSIVIFTPYFMPRPWLIKALKRAVKRKIEVQIIIPSKADNLSSPLINRLNYLYISKICLSGIKFFLLPNMNHAKAILIDEKEGMVGSQNMDFLSYGHNAEIGVFFQDPAMVSDLKKIFDKWKKQSAPFNHLAFKPKWYDFFISPIIRIFQIVV